MNITNKIILITSAAIFITGHFLLAGDSKTFKEKVVLEEPAKLFNAELSTGWDSLYMFRGVNVLRITNYGSGIYWMDGNFTWNITDNDSLNAGAWMAFGTQHNIYKELDAYTKYTHTFGNLAVSLGYIFYYVMDPVELYSHELSAEVAYTFDLGFMTVTPSVGYFFNLGPDNTEEAAGIAPRASSYLLARIDGSIPIYKDIISLEPWIAYGTNFEYNGKLQRDGELDFFNGANNVEVGLGIPIKINDMISLYGYGAYSYAFSNLVGTTEPSTFWGGAKVVFSF